jgi:ABC-2 type transport system permease protein
LRSHEGASRSARGTPAWLWLLRKECRELASSRAWWVLLVLTGPLVGLSFINSVDAFSEVSAGAGPGCGAVCAPLLGVWGPTFGAYEIAAIFLLPFVAIRLMSGDRQSGALTLELQRPMSPFARVAAKAIALLGGWVLSGAAAVVALALWKSYGGSTYAPEMAVVALGHILNAGLTVGLAIAVASMTDHPSTAAIITLAITIGTWVIDFAAAIHGGIWETVARFTPSAVVTLFQHGLVQVNALLIVVVIIMATLAIGAVWIQLGQTVRHRAGQTVAVIAATAVLVTVCAFVRGSWDASESRMNSFDEPEQEALEHLHTPIAIAVHLSPQDPRRMQFERGPLAKLRRVVPDLRVTFVSRTSSGLYEQADPGYGEVQYAVAGHQAANRMVTDEGVIETIFDLAGIAPASDTDIPYLGRPFIGRASGAAFVFYGMWPVLVGGLGVWVLRRHV